jgi:acetyltransferase-like isoleucine patch superfamily enzyme
VRPLRERLASRLVYESEELRSKCWSLAVRASAVYWDVDLGEGSRFYGPLNLRKAAGSRIIIGRGCVFRSSQWSNRVGLDRPCMLSTLYEGAQITIGDGSGLSGTVIAAATAVDLGRSVFCGGNVTIMDTDWHGVAIDRRGRHGASRPVAIEDNVWLGLGVVVLKGVTIGRDTVVAARSVVSRSLPPGVIAAGNPAVPVRSIVVRCQEQAETTGCEA